MYAQVLPKKADAPPTPQKMTSLTVEAWGPDEAEAAQPPPCLSPSVLLLFVGIGHPPPQDNVYTVLHNYRNTKSTFLLDLYKHQLVYFA